MLRPGDVMAAELETVLYAQMLILFAPHAVPAPSHLPLLLANLASRQPALRQAAAATLRHLAEQVCRNCWESSLLMSGRPGRCSRLVGSRRLVMCKLH